ncbi:MAG: hypothetical protein AAFP00_17115 [Bacteroidota bacterium]
MPISYQDIRDDRQWRAATGLTGSQFKTLLSSFRKTYEDFLGESLSGRQEGLQTPNTFQTYEDLLFFILYSIKSGLTYDLLGLSFGIDRATAFRQQTFAIRILEMTLQQSGHLPKRFFEDLSDFKVSMAQEEELLLDASEQRRQRPQDQEVQQKNYSGKKKDTP